MEYVGFNEAAKKITAGYVSPSGTAKKLKYGYVGVGGVAKKIFEKYANYKKYSITREWEEYQSASLVSAGILGNPDFLYVVGRPAFKRFSEGQQHFDFSAGVTSKSLERDYGVRAWVANSDSIKSNPSQGMYNHYAFVSQASYGLFSWDYDATIFSIREKQRLRGTYIETISAPIGAYPDNGIQDGCWWIREGYESFDRDLALNKGNLISAPGWSAIEYLDVPAGCTNITIETGQADPGHDCLCEYDADRNYLSYWGAGENPRTFSFDYPNQIRFVRATFLASAIDNCYIYDNSNHQYIWKGKNV